MLYDMTIKPKDRLTIFVFSGTNEEAVALLNPREPVPIDFSKRNGTIMRESTGQTHHYLVENDGTIEFPLVGKIMLGGLTVEQANRTIHQKIKPFLSESVDVVVNTY